jgi:5-methylcytosine-specific restriction endonuclease McrA
MSLSELFEQTLVKLCQNTQTNPIKTSDFENGIIQAIIYDFINDMFMAYTFAYREKVSSDDLCNFNNNMQGLANDVSKDHEMTIEKNKINDFSHMYRLPFLNSLSEISKIFVNDWIDIAVDYDYDFAKIEKYDGNIKKYFMFYHFKKIFKIVLEYKNTEIINLVNEHFIKMNINVLLDKHNLDHYKSYIIKAKYHSDMFNDLEKFKNFAKDINNYLVKKDYLSTHKFIKCTVTNEEIKSILKLLKNTIQFMCKMNDYKELQDDNKILLKKYINQFGKAIVTINKSFQTTILTIFSETVFLSEFITKTVSNTDFNYVFDEKLLTEAIDNLQELPAKGLIFIKELCNYVLFNKFDTNKFINVSQYYGFVDFVNLKVKIDLCLSGEEYKNFLNDTIKKVKKTIYKTSEPLTFDINHTMELLEFINEMNKFNYKYCYGEIVQVFDKSEKTKEKPTKEKPTKEKPTKEKPTKEKVVKEKVIKEKVVKEKIPLSVKHAVWDQSFGKCMDGICQCCKTTPIHSTNFDCGHIISEKNGGKVHLENLRPICRTCNSSMGTQNMDDYIVKYGFDKINATEPKSKEQSVKFVIVDSNDNEITNYLDLLKKDNLIKLCDALEIKYVKNGLKKEFVDNVFSKFESMTNSTQHSLKINKSDNKKNIIYDIIKSTTSK